MLVKLNWSMTCPSSPFFNFLLLNVLRFLYWTFFDILPQEILDYTQGSTNFFGKSQTVNSLGFACPIVSVATSSSDTVAKK